ncbi:hypothetical protein BC828DRAFT_438105 [Blastocladiella britannica]|nr:hypothetical protein BC828DRAFT_438105 [Blastocladiella britannica]
MAMLPPRPDPSHSALLASLLATAPSDHPLLSTMLRLRSSYIDSANPLLWADHPPLTTDYVHEIARQYSDVLGAAAVEDALDAETKVVVRDTVFVEALVVLERCLVDDSTDGEEDGPLACISMVLAWEPEPPGTDDEDNDGFGDPMAAGGGQWAYHDLRVIPEPEWTALEDAVPRVPASFAALQAMEPLAVLATHGFDATEDDTWVIPSSSTTGPKSTSSSITSSSVANTSNLSGGVDETGPRGVGKQQQQQQTSKAKANGNGNNNNNNNSKKQQPTAPTPPPAPAAAAPKPSKKEQKRANAAAPAANGMASATPAAVVAAVSAAPTTHDSSDVTPFVVSNSFGEQLTPVIDKVRHSAASSSLAARGFGPARKTPALPLPWTGPSTAAATTVAAASAARAPTAAPPFRPPMPKQPSTSASRFAHYDGGVATKPSGPASVSSTTSSSTTGTGGGPAFKKKTKAQKKAAKATSAAKAAAKFKPSGQLASATAEAVAAMALNGAHDDDGDNGDSRYWESYTELFGSAGPAVSPPKAAPKVMDAEDAYWNQYDDDAAMAAAWASAPTEPAAEASVPVTDWAAEASVPVTDWAAPSEPAAVEVSEQMWAAPSSETEVMATWAAAAASEPAPERPAAPVFAETAQAPAAAAALASPPGFNFAPIDLRESVPVPAVVPAVPAVLSAQDEVVAAVTEAMDALHHQYLIMMQQQQQQQQQHLAMQHHPHHAAAAVIPPHMAAAVAMPTMDSMMMYQQQQYMTYMQPPVQPSPPPRPVVSRAIKIVAPAGKTSTAAAESEPTSASTTPTGLPESAVTAAPFIPASMSAASSLVRGLPASAVAAAPFVPSVWTAAAGGGPRGAMLNVLATASKSRAVKISAPPTKANKATSPSVPSSPSSSASRTVRITAPKPKLVVTPAALAGADEDDVADFLARIDVSTLPPLPASPSSYRGEIQQYEDDQEEYDAQEEVGTVAMEAVHAHLAATARLLRDLARSVGIADQDAVESLLVAFAAE